MNTLDAIAEFDAVNTVDPESDAGPFNEAQHLLVSLSMRGNKSSTISPEDRNGTPVGKCIDCCSNIAKERMEALGPEVARCLECQKTYELNSL